MSDKAYLKGAAAISAGGIVSKLLGAFYRIPLLSLLGSRGMGVYQMVYPLYCMLLTLSASGLPTGIARAMSSGQCTFAERPAFWLCGFMGAAGWLIMSVLAPVLAAAQGEAEVALCCKILAPSVFLVSLISVVRGCFQGRGYMLPTAVTEVFEQLVKVLCGIALCMLRPSPASAVLAVTLSEVCCLALALAMYRSAGGSKVPLGYRPSRYYPCIFKNTAPLALSAMAQPLSQLVESVVVVALLRAASQDATALWGVFSGCAVTLISLPASAAYGLAAAAVPRVARAGGHGDAGLARSRVTKSLLFTLALALPSAIALFAFSPFAVSVIFSSLSGGERMLVVRLVKSMCLSAVAMPLVQTSSACLAALGRAGLGAVTQWSTCLVRVALSAAAVTALSSVTGAAISANICNLVAVALNLWYIYGVRGDKNAHNSHRFGNKRRRYDAVG